MGMGSTWLHWAGLPGAHIQLPGFHAVTWSRSQTHAGHGKMGKGREHYGAGIALPLSLLSWPSAMIYTAGFIMWGSPQEHGAWAENLGTAHGPK